MKLFLHPAVGAFLLAVTAVCSAPAQVIYNDSFNREGHLAESSPEINTTGEAYSESQPTYYSYNTVPGPGKLSIAADYDSAYLPFNLAPADSVITLSITASCPSAGKQLDLGFFDQKASTATTQIYNSNAPWVAVNDGYVQCVVRNTSAGPAVNDYFNLDTTAPHTYTIAYDTVAKVTSFYIDGTLETTANGVQSYQSIGLTGIGYDVHNFAVVTNLNVTIVPKSRYEKPVARPDGVGRTRPSPAPQR